VWFAALNGPRPAGCCWKGPVQRVSLFGPWPPFQWLPGWLGSQPLTGRGWLAGPPVSRAAGWLAGVRSPNGPRGSLAGSGLASGRLLAALGVRGWAGSGFTCARRANGYAGRANGLGFYRLAVGASTAGGCPGCLLCVGSAPQLRATREPPAWADGTTALHQAGRATALGVRSARNSRPGLW